nr:HTTM domain-containing protein [Echinimonas agarilytica]
MALAVLAALALLVGYKTRLATAVSWVLLMSVQIRNPILLSGADDLMRVLLFWAMFLPLGARFAIDSALEKNQPYPQQNHFSVATIAMLMQAMYVYWAGALLKTGKAWTEDYTAVYYALNAEHYTTYLGHWIGNVLEPILPMLTQFVFYIELYGPLFLITPFLLLWFRLPALVLLICMHIGFLLLLNVGHFPYVSITSLLLFTPSAVWAMVDSKWVAKRSSGVMVYYDEGCEFCKKTVYILRTMLLLPRIEVLPAQGDSTAAPLLDKHDSWVVKSADDTYRLEWDALTWLVGQSPLLFWMKWPMKGLQALNQSGDRCYHFIGNRRMVLGKFTQRALPWRHSSGKHNWGAQLVVLALAVMVLQINLSYVSTVPQIDSSLIKVRNALGLWQKWNMFAPFPITQTRWPIVEGLTIGGNKVDLYRNELSAPPRAKPDTLTHNHRSYRWRKYLGRLYLKRYSRFRRPFVNYQCMRWNKTMGSDPHYLIRKVNLLTGILPTHLPPQKGKEKITNQGTYTCR